MVPDAPPTVRRQFTTPYLQRGLRDDVEVITHWHYDAHGERTMDTWLDVTESFDGVAATLGYVQPHLNPDLGWRREDDWATLVHGQPVRVTVGRSSIEGDFLYVYTSASSRRTADIVPTGSTDSVLFGIDDTGWVLFVRDDA